jgi:hypothetical protein
VPATLAVAVANLLMAGGNGTGAVALYIIAGLITVGMAAVPWFYLR